MSLSSCTKILCITGAPLNDFALMKICPGECKVCQISSHDTMHSLALCMQILSWRGSYFLCYAPCERHFCVKLAFINTIGKIHLFKNSKKLEIKFYLTSIVWKWLFKMHFMSALVAILMTSYFSPYAGLRATNWFKLLHMAQSLI